MIVLYRELHNPQPKLAFFWRCIAECAHHRHHSFCPPPAPRRWFDYAYTVTAHYTFANVPVTFFYNLIKRAILKVVKDWGCPMIIDEIVTASLLAAIKKLGSQSQLASSAGIPRTKPGQYIHKKSDSIPNATWEKLWPILSACHPALRAPQYLPPSELKKLAASPPRPAAGGASPCGQAPPELTELCRQWADMEKEKQDMILGVIRPSLKKTTAQPQPLPDAIGAVA